MLRDPRLVLLRRWLCVIPGVLLVALAAGLTPAGAQDSQVSVAEATLRWGMNSEANNRSPIPGPEGIFNFFSSGRIPKPSNGVVAPGQWAQSTGSVRIEKWNGSSYQPATWSGLGSDSSGMTIPSFLSGRYSGHQFVFTKGVGTLDRATGTARIQWRGDVSVIFYGGMVFFYLSDPLLEVAEGQATLKATVSGFGSSQDNPDVSFPVAPREVIVAQMPAVALGELGFTATPSYDGVRTNVLGQSVTGSFPQSFVSAMEPFGTAPFWHNSGGSLDQAKRPQPLTVSYEEGRPQQPAAPPVTAPRPEITNTAKEAPAPRSVPTSANPGALNAPAPEAPPEPAGSALMGAADGSGLVPTTSSAALHLVAAQARPPSRWTPLLGWYLGAGLFLLAGFILVSSLLLPTSPSRRRTTSGR